jgi:predicted phage terminase large subunit-like protein
MINPAKIPKKAINKLSYQRIGQSVEQGVVDECRYDLGKFIKVFFAHHTEYGLSKMHKDFIELEKGEPRRGRRDVTVAPRGNAKTTFKALFKPIHDICYKNERFIVVIGFSRAEAMDKVADIRDELATNKRLIEVFGQLATTRMSKVEFVTFNNIKVVARSKGGQVRGLKFGSFRPTKFILDDIESLESVNTPEQRSKTANWFNKDVMGAGSADGKTNYEIIGTVLNEEALMETLQTAPGWNSIKYKSIINWPTNQHLWDQWEAIYRNIDNDNNLEDAKQFYIDNQEAMDEGVEVLWPEGEPFYQLMEYKIQYGEASLYSEKQNDPFDPTKQIFDPSKVKRFRIVWPESDEWPVGVPRDGFLIRHNDNDVEWYSKDLKIVAFHDPALVDAKTNDYTAIVVTAQAPSKRIYVLEAFVDRVKYDKQILKAYELYERYNYDKLYLETNGFQELLKPLFKAEEEQQGYKLKIEGVKQHKNKEHRISTMQPYFSNEWVLFNQDISHLLTDQLRQFPTGDHDDAPDALQGCISRLKKPINTIKVNED